MNRFHISGNMQVFYQNISNHLYYLFLISFTVIVLASTSLSLFGFLLQVNAQSETNAVTPSDEPMDSFLISGNLNSTLFTDNGNWHAVGPFALVVANGKVTLFDVDMNWDNNIKSHTHQLRNFESDDDDIELKGDRDLSIEGKMDVATNGTTYWSGVDGIIKIEKGEIISISVDYEDTDGHFGDQVIDGTVAVIKPCNLTPGPSMQLPTGCF